MSRGRKIKNRTGDTHGALTVICRAGRDSKGVVLWKCACCCGNTTILSSIRLSNGIVDSCGCIRKRLTEMRTGNPLYHKWSDMKRRCYNEKNSVYKYYGQKGIAVCRIWRRDFFSFLKWAIANGYRHGLSLDRVESNLGYLPSNCRFITRSENSRRSTQDKIKKRILNGL